MLCFYSAHRIQVESSTSVSTAGAETRSVSGSASARGAIRDFPVCKLGAAAYALAAVGTAFCIRGSTKIKWGVVNLAGVLAGLATVLSCQHIQNKSVHSITLMGVTVERRTGWCHIGAIPKGTKVSITFMGGARLTIEQGEQGYTLFKTAGKLPSITLNGNVLRSLNTTRTVGLGSVMVGEGNT